MNKKFWVILLTLLTALCLCLGLSACGGNDNPGETTNPGEQGGTSETDPGEQGGETNPPTHVHSYTVENECSVCGAKWEFTDGLTYELDESTDTSP